MGYVHMTVVLPKSITKHFLFNLQQQFKCLLPSIICHCTTLAQYHNTAALDHPTRALLSSKSQVSRTPCDSTTGARNNPCSCIDNGVCCKPYRRVQGV